MRLPSGRGLAAALACSSALCAPALAHAADGQSATAVQEVVVTGTLFRTKAETASPVTKLTQKSIRQAGITTIADAVRTISADNSGTLPQTYAAAFAAGAQGVSLRGLTVNSTLVLIDGLRTANYALADDGQRAFVDLNTIPESVVDRVEVLKDGASSIYGADAIGGVVNVIMKRQFVGEEAEAEGGTSQHGGGTMYRFNGTAGYGDLDTNRYNGYLSFEYEHDDKIEVGQRPYPFNSYDFSPLGGIDNQGGQWGAFSGSTYGAVSDAVTGGPSQVLAPGGCGKGSKLSGDLYGNVFCEQNRALYADDQGDQTRFGFYGRFTAQLTPSATASFNASYYQTDMRYSEAPKQIQTTAPVNTDGFMLPAILTGGPNAGQLNPNNPFAALGHPAFVSYAFGDILSYVRETNHVFRAAGDIKGRAWGWDYDAAAVVAHTWLDTTNAGYINYDRLIHNINSGAYSFVDPASNSPAVRKALAPDLRKTSTTDLDTINLQASRPLYALPGGDLSLAVGAAWRYEGTNDPDLNPGGEAQSLGVAHTVGHRNVASAFAELDAPVIHGLDIDVSGRYDHYSDAGDNLSPKVGVKWAPIRQFALRGTWSLGFRAPSFAENGSSASEGFTAFQADPATFASFYNAHHGDAYVSNAYQLGVLTTANPRIKPEKSESYTVGAIVAPLSDFNVSVDYYHIQKTDVIAQTSPIVALASYLYGAPVPAGYTVIADAPDPLYPSALARPTIIGSPYINANSLVTDGLDIDVRFTHDLPYDVHFASDFNWTDVFNFTFSQPGLPTLNYVGLQSPYGLSTGAGTPKYRWNWTNSVSRGPITLAATVYYVSSIKMVAADYLGPDVCAALVLGFAPNDCKAPAFVDVDLHGSYDVNRKVQVYVDVMNLMDALPPFDPISYASINYNATYSQAGIVGRYFKVGVRAKF